MRRGRVKAITVDVENALPHGSGIDADWNVERQVNGAMVAYNGYHCMDEYGGYAGWAWFTVKIYRIRCPWDSTGYYTDMELHFTGRASRRRAERYNLRDMLATDIGEHLRAAGILLDTFPDPEPYNNATVSGEEGRIGQNLDVIA